MLLPWNMVETGLGSSDNWNSNTGKLTKCIDDDSGITQANKTYKKKNVENKILICILCY